jgi:hypothetical protein
MHTASFALRAQGIERVHHGVPATVHGRSRGLVRSGCLQPNSAAHVVSVPHRLGHCSKLYGQLTVHQKHRETTKNPTYHGSVL